VHQNKPKAVGRALRSNALKSVLVTLQVANPAQLSVLVARTERRAVCQSSSISSNFKKQSPFTQNWSNHFRVTWSHETNTG